MHLTLNYHWSLHLAAQQDYIYLSRMSLFCPKLTHICLWNTAPYPAFSCNKYWLKSPGTFLKVLVFIAAGCQLMTERNAVHLRNSRDTLPVMTRKIYRSADISHYRKHITFNKCSNFFSFALTYPGTDIRTVITYKGWHSIRQWKQEM